jgi:hypothetical protein
LESLWCGGWQLLQRELFGTGNRGMFSQPAADDVQGQQQRGGDGVIPVAGHLVSLALLQQCAVLAGRAPDAASPVFVRDAPHVLRAAMPVITASNGGGGGGASQSAARLPSAVQAACARSLQLSFLPLVCAAHMQAENEVVQFKSEDGQQDGVKEMLGQILAMMYGSSVAATAASALMEHLSQLHPDLQSVAQTDMMRRLQHGVWRFLPRATSSAASPASGAGHNGTAAASGKASFLDIAAQWWPRVQDLEPVLEPVLLQHMSREVVPEPAVCALRTLHALLGVAPASCVAGGRRFLHALIRLLASSQPALRQVAAYLPLCVCVRVCVMGGGAPLGVRTV